MGVRGARFFDICEKNTNDAEKYTWDGVKISLVYISCVALTFIFFPHIYLSLFKSDASTVVWQQVELLAPQLLVITAIFTLFDSAYLNISFALKAAGDTRFVSLVALIVPWPFMVLPAILLMDHQRAAVLSWYFVILYSSILVAILSMRFRKGKWKSINLIAKVSVAKVSES